MREASDAELIRASLEDPERFGAVFERHWEAVRRYAQRRAGRQAGEEVAARTFEVAFRIRGSYRTELASARPWLLGIATNLIGRHLRAERARLRALARVPPGRDDAPPDERAVAAADAARLAPALAAALAELEPRDRDVLLLRAWGDLTYAEIAVALAIPEGTARSRLHRARRELRERLGGVAGIPGQEEEEEGRA